MLFLIRSTRVANAFTVFSVQQHGILDAISLPLLMFTVGSSSNALRFSRRKIEERIVLKN
jgi:hypothetical protein